MEVIVEQLGFRLKSHHEGRCYELSRWRPERIVVKGAHKGRVVAAGWSPAESYPSSLVHGLKMILERSVNDSKEPSATIEAAVEAIQASARAIDAAAEKVVQGQTVAMSG